MGTIMGGVAQKHQNYLPRSSFRIVIAIADAPGTLHHVMGRGIAGTKIFRKDTDREDFPSPLGERWGRWDIRVRSCPGFWV
jgi:hypothetical protein